MTTLGSWSASLARRRGNANRNLISPIRYSSIKTPISFFGGS